MECVERVSQDVEQFMEQAGLSEAFLFGGAVLDPLVWENAKISDYDICVKDKEVFYEALKNMKDQDKDIAISEVMRTHNIYVVIKHPTLGQIDFSCMDPETNGIFNIEKIYAKFRKKSSGECANIVVDKYGAIDSIKRGEIRLSCDPQAEGAYNLLRRFLAVASKYNLDISANGRNQETINEIKDAFSAEYSHIPQDKVRCLSRLSASLRRSKDREGFVKSLGAQHMFAVAFPEIDKLFNKPIFYTSARLKACETQRDLLELMAVCVQKEDRDALVDCLRILSRREAARQDKGVKAFVEALEQEKTSVSRLNNQILNPLLAYVSARKEGCNL